MPVAKAERPVFAFTKGLNTDASEVIFPADFSTDEQNFELMLDGSRRKRRGLEAESDNVLDATQPDEAVVRTFKWRSVGGDPDINLHCVQVGSTMYFMDDVVNPSESVRSFTLDLTTLAVDGFSGDVVDNLVDMAFGRGHALIVGKVLEPHFLEYDSATDSLIATQIPIRERDFQGVEDGVDNQTQPATLTDEYQYNLINQGWIYGDVLAYQASQGTYPSKNMIPWFGYRRATVVGYDPNDGTKEFSPDKLVAELFQDAPAPRGHFVRNPFDTNVTVEVETETVKNYVSLIKPSGHAHFDQLAPPGIPSQENGPNFMNLPSGAVPTTQTLLTFKFNEPHFLNVGDVVEFFTETRGRIGSNTGDGNRNWEIEGNRTVEAVVDDNTISFYNSLTNDAAGWRTTWPYSYWPIMYAFVGGDVLDIEGAVIDERPTAVAFFAGRAVYGGVPHPTLGSALFFSQVVEVDAQYGKCYQVADPTSDKISDLVPTDGLVLRIPEMGRVYKLQNYGSSLIVWASNGIWQVGPGADGYFTAVSYSIRKLSNVSVVNGTSVLDCEGVPMGWASSGVFAILEDTNTGFLVARSLTEGVIDRFFAELGETVRRTSTGDYDEVNKRAVWVYTQDDEYFALVFDTRFRAFTTWKFEAPVYDIFTTTERNSADSTLRFIVLDDDFVVATATSLTFADFETEYDAYIVCGFDTADSPARRKHAPVVTVFSKRTELASVEIEDGGGEEDEGIALARFIGLRGGPITNEIMTSEDGITWTERVTPSCNLKFVTYSPQLHLLVAVGDQYAMASSDGITWGEIFELSIPGGDFHTSVAWSSTLGLFVCVSNQLFVGPKLRTSPDGFTWTLRTPATGTTSLTDVVWDPRNERFYATGNASAVHNVQYSTDGINWVRATGSSFSGGAYRLAVGANNLCASSNGDTITFKSNADGSVWSNGGSTGSGSNCIAYGNGKFVLSNVFGGRFYSTDDGATWTTGTGHIHRWSAMCYSPSLDRFVGLNDGAGGPGTYHSATSEDGIDWVAHALSGVYGFNNVLATF